MKTIRIVGLLIFLVFCSHFSMGINGNIPNPTGGFGNNNNNNGASKINQNPTGGFGPSNPVPQTLGTPPPPPPTPTPLDPGVIILIVATLALGFKKLYNRVPSNDVAVK